MTTETYFFDTYAFFEILYQNPAYHKYLHASIITTKLNLFELYYNLIKEYDKKTAVSILSAYSQFIVDFDIDILQEAAHLKKLFREKVSMTDAIGYMTAKKAGIKFLTGDKQFQFLPDVEFVK